MSLLIRLYPRSWRERYEEELTVLLEDRPPGRPTRSTWSWAPSTHTCIAGPWAAAPLGATGA